MEHRNLDHSVFVIQHVKIYIAKETLLIRITFYLQKERETIYFKSKQINNTLIQLQSTS